MGKIVRVVALVAVTVLIATYAPTLAPQLLAALGTQTATALAVNLTIAAITVVGSLAASIAINAVLPPPRASSGGAQAAMSVFRQSISNSFVIYGRRRVGGLLIFFHPKGKDWRYFVIACAGHRCHGAIGWYLNNEIVEVDGDGMVTTGAYANRAWLWFYRGTDDQIADPTFVAECDGQWTENHRAQGVALIYAKFEMVDKVVQAGMPTINAVIEGKDDIRDPRTGSRGYTRLATPIIYDWMALPREEGGFGAEADEIPDDDLLSAWTNVCDENLLIADGVTEKRYELDCWITTGSAPSEVRKTFIDCTAGSYTYSDGKFLMRPGYWVGPSHSLEERDLAGPIRVTALGDPQAIVTELSGTFVDPNNNFQPMPVPTRSVATSDIRQGDADLAHITSSTRGERILEIMLQRAQCEKRVTWPMNIAGIAVQALDTVQLDTARYGLSNYAFVVDNWGLSSDFSVALSLREENEEIYSDAITYRSGFTAPDLWPADPIGYGIGVSEAIIPGAGFVACDADGTPKAGQLPLTAQVILYDGVTDVHLSATYAIEAGATGGTWSVDSSGLVTFDTMTADDAAAVILITYGSVNRKVPFGVKKVRDGATGGATGSPYGAVTVNNVGANQYQPIPVLQAGQTITYWGNVHFAASGGPTGGSIVAEYSLDGSSWSNAWTSGTDTDGTGGNIPNGDDATMVWNVTLLNPTAGSQPIWLRVTVIDTGGAGSIGFYPDSLSRISVA